MKVLLDNGIISHAEFLSPAIRDEVTRWGEADVKLSIHGLVKTPPDKSIQHQEEKNSLFTVGRLIRKGRITAYNYSEILWERARGRSRVQEGNALRHCTLQRCVPALERSRFRSGDFKNMITKGGKKDRKAGKEISDISQIPFFEWLVSLNEMQIASILSYTDQIGLTEFEVESWKGLRIFQELCTEAGGSENYPDAFHLWTAERNGLDVLLTLDKKLAGLSSRIKSKMPQFHAEALMPLAILRKMGIEYTDPVPIEDGRFYCLHEVAI